MKLVHYEMPFCIILKGTLMLSSQLVVIWDFLTLFHNE